MKDRRGKLSCSLGTGPLGVCPGQVAWAIQGLPRHLYMGVIQALQDC